ncbi:hypothetical protein [Candidatus Erwinia dacicola]|uniref:Uncharacterized protein n=1 Tax=Candidatus Erwinia dacicola TaxID=252393 RepID=A0A1E7Z380_9GAMM|nr:hypothetical protein [Candidatus Erwinia dacicola]NJC99491.1 hypothetical protein [Candidatus Erwinia dacicola]OFC63203.1 hypothetical protein BBW68_06280 [Candidatus Erwinia dacicola]RAP71581.1 hypothetical protein ACZ87_01597 [Candidatus Erwinia dacicola]
MQDEIRAPKTARDALLIELIGDLGVLHDNIKSLPEAINQATAGSIETIANAVEEAEKTASKLSESIEQKKEAVLADLKTSVKQTLDEHAVSVFSELEDKVNGLQKRIATFELSDPKSRRLNIILSCTLAVSLLLSGTAIFAVYSAEKSTIADLNMIISSQDKTSTK